jgi:hypothetical protein
VEAVVALHQDALAIVAGIAERREGDHSTLVSHHMVVDDVVGDEMAEAVDSSMLA